MKQTAALCLLALMLLLSACGLCAGEGYASDFSSGTDGWYARSMGTAKLSVSDGCALAISGRADNWHSPGRDFSLLTGVRYALSVQVRQSSLPEAKLILSVAHTADGIESYENIASAACRQGEWTTISATYTAGRFDRFVLYIETADAPSLSYEIRNFTYEPMEESYAQEASVPALKDIYADHFHFGTAVTQAEAFSPARMDFYASQFNLFTPGNELKPDSVLDVMKSAQLAKTDETAVAVRFNAAKPLLDYAQSHGIKVHGHVLVWHQQTPEAFFHEGYSPAKPLVNREVLLARLDNYVREVMDYLDTNYPGVVVSWDVVNEAIDDSTGRLRNSKWLQIVGEDYVARAFEIARRHAPEGVLLYYNDYNTAMLVKQTGIVKLLESLIAEGNIDGYGFQMHHDIAFPSALQISSSVQRIASLGIKLRVSELDVTIPDRSEANLQRQAQLYGQIMNILLPYAGQLTAVQVWGVTDDLSWRAPQYPLLFDAQGQPKPAFWAVADPSSIQ